MDADRPMVKKGSLACPACGGKLVSILYGLPSSEGFAAAERGEIALGGCTVMGDDPQLACSACHERYHVESP